MSDGPVKLTHFTPQRVCEFCRYLHHDNQMDVEYCDKGHEVFDNSKPVQIIRRMLVGCADHKYMTGYRTGTRGWNLQLAKDSDNER